MSNVIHGAFGFSKEDIATVANIYRVANVDCDINSDPVQRFNNLSAYSLKANKVIEATYINLGGLLDIAHVIFYNNGQKDSDLVTVDRIRKNMELIESLLRGDE